MEFSLNNKVLEYMEAVHRSSISHEVTAESIIPDSMPDAQRVIETSGMVCLRSKEAEDGRMTITGTVSVAVIYADDEGMIKKTDISLPFNVPVENGDIKSDAKMTADVRLASCDTRLLNPRKMFVRCDILIDAACYALKELQVKQPTDVEASVRLLTEEYKLRVLTEVFEKSFVVREEYTLPTSKPLVGEILKTNVQLALDEVKGIGKKVILKGAAKVNVLYRPEKGGEPVNVEFSTVYSQIMEQEIQADGLSYTAFFVPTSLYFDTESLFVSEDRRIVLEAHILAQCISYREEVVCCIADAYSSKYEISTEMEKMGIESVEKPVKLVQPVRGMIEVSRQPGSIVCITAMVGPVYKSREGDKPEVKSTVTVSVLYMSEDGMLLSASKKLNVSAETEAAESGDCAIKAYIEKEPIGVISTDGIELRFELVFRSENCCRNDISGISKIEVDTDKPKDISVLPSVVVKRFCNGDTLWEIAKKYSSARELILKANGIEEGKEPELNTMLIIPKVR